MNNHICSGVPAWSETPAAAVQRSSRTMHITVRTVRITVLRSGIYHMIRNT